MKLLKQKRITGKIIVETGLHIGAGSDVIEIGGMDNPILRDPFTEEPYIPGSSLKGKMRALYEWYEKREDLIENNGETCKCGKSTCLVCTVFGAPAVRSNDTNGNEEAKKRGPTRLIVRDAFLSDKTSKKDFEENKPIVEEKYENSINRITAAANPRPIERVVPGTEFTFSIVYRVFDRGDNGIQDEDNFKNVVLRSMKLLEGDYLGGGGSRGNGKIIFKELREDDENFELSEIEV